VDFVRTAARKCRFRLLTEYGLIIPRRGSLPREAKALTTLVLRGLRFTSQLQQRLLILDAAIFRVSRKVRVCADAGVACVRDPQRGCSTIAIRHSATWLILPVVICLSQRLSHARLSSGLFGGETANGSIHQLWFIRLCESNWYNCGNSRANTCSQASTPGNGKEERFY
jgi:hypothetical protein